MAYNCQVDFELNYYWGQQKQSKQNSSNSPLVVNSEAKWEYQQVFAVGSLEGENQGVGCVGLPAVFAVYSGYTVVYCIQCLWIVITVYSGFTDSLLHTLGLQCVNSLQWFNSVFMVYSIFYSLFTVYIGYILFLDATV